jgi:hypothetical protein
LQVARHGPLTLFGSLVVLLPGIVIPGLVSSAAALWTMVSETFDISGIPSRLLVTVFWLAVNFPYTHVYLIANHTLAILMGTCFCQRAAQPCVGDYHCTAGADPAKYVTLLSAVVAVTEDLLFMGVTSMLYLPNNWSTGHGVSTLVYCISMPLSCMHVLMEAWEHFPSIHQDCCACLAGVFNLRP